MALGRQLVRLGFAQLSQDGFNTVSLTAAGLQALKQRTPVILMRAPVTAETPAMSASAAARAGDIPCDEGCSPCFAGSVRKSPMRAKCPPM